MNLTGYNLSRKWFDFCFENPEKITPLHISLYFFAVEHCNRLGWKKKFGLPTEMAKEAIGVKSWHTYIKAFNDIVEWGFFILIEKSKNQYSSNIIALSNFDEALDEALDEAISKHVSKQQQCTYQSTCQSNDSIFKLITNNIKLINDNKDKFEKFVLSLNKNSDIHTWKTDFEIYLSELRKEYSEIIKDKEYISRLEEYHPKLNIILSIEKSCFSYWATNEGWQNKKKKKTETIDWKSTFSKTITLNAVYK